jgi:hypothetical protein
MAKPLSHGGVGLLVYGGSEEGDPISMQEAEELARISAPYARQGRANAKRRDAKSVWYFALGIKAGLLILDTTSSPSSR